MTATCHTRTHAAYTDAVGAEIARLASIARDADPSAPVPTCPEWTVKDLLEHVGGVHRWAGTMVAQLAPERLRPGQLDLGIPDDPGALPEWIAQGADVLVPALRDADPDASMWAWGSDPHARFWARRMLHETTIHRADAEFALGRSPSVDEGVAVDGIDEFLDNLPHAAYFAPRVKELRGEGQRLRVGTPAASWVVTLGPAGFTWQHADDPGDAAVEGAAGDMLLFVYGRREAATVTGDRVLVERWTASSSI